jgi:RND family efflux transporter MFP subunit
MNTVKKIVAILLALAITAFLVMQMVHGPESPQEKRQYHCPMHPTYIADKSGDCPICGMRLVPIETKTAPAVEAKYVCPMHPEVVDDKPSRCPKCGMKLVPANKNAAPEISTAAEQPSESTPKATDTVKPGQILFYRNPMNPEITSTVPAKDEMGMDYVPVYAETAPPKRNEVAGLAAVTVNDQGIRLAGIQTTKVIRKSIVRTIRTVGSVVPDETRVRHVHTKIAGWVEKLFINFTGQSVRKGEPILAIYSPELLATQEEFLQARQSASQFAGSALTEVKKGRNDLIKAAVRRLELFDVPANFIEELKKTGKPQRNVTLVAPVSGFVTAKQIFEGQQVEPGMELFIVTDLSKIWIEAAIYENEASLIRLGQKATFSLPYDPGKELHGTVKYIFPFLNAESRTLKIRFDLENRDYDLKPGMFVDVDLAVTAQTGLVIPDSALIDTGVRQLVYVATGPNEFVPRLVQVGIRSDGNALILSGLTEGEAVVVKGNFLLDSESRIRAAISATTSSQPSAPASPESAGQKQGEAQ